MRGRPVGVVSAGSKRDRALLRHVVQVDARLLDRDELAEVAHVVPAGTAHCVRNIASVRELSVSVKQNLGRQTRTRTV